MALFSTRKTYVKKKRKYSKPRTNPVAKAQDKAFAMAYVANGGNGTAAAKLAYNKSSDGAAACKSLRRLKDEEVRADIMALTDNVGLTVDWVKVQHLKNVHNDERSERSKDMNLNKLGDIVGAYKDGLSSPAPTQVLNITNVMNIVNQHVTKDTLHRGTEIEGEFLEEFQ